MPKLTVITPYYNRPHGIQRTLDSVLKQIYQDFDYIVVEDKSTDDTLLRLQEYSNLYPDKRLHLRPNPENIGVTRSLAHAVKSTDSDYVAIVGSGDVASPTRFEMQVSVLDEHPEISVVGSYYSTYYEAKNLRVAKKPDADGLQFQDIIDENPFTHGEVMFRRSAYERAGGYRASFRYAQDYDLWLRMIKTGPFHTIKDFLYTRYVEFEGVTYNPKVFPIQARYSMIARRMAQADPEAAKQLLEQLEKDGPSSIVKATDPELQKRLIKASMRSAVWGNTGAAKALISESVTSSSLRFLLLSLVNISELPLGQLVLRAARSRLGVSSS